MLVDLTVTFVPLANVVTTAWLVDGPFLTFSPTFATTYLVVDVSLLELGALLLKYWFETYPVVLPVVILDQPPLLDITLTLVPLDKLVIIE